MSTIGLRASPRSKDGTCHGQGVVAGDDRSPIRIWPDITVGAGTVQGQSSVEPERLARVIALLPPVDMVKALTDFYFEHVQILCEQAVLCPFVMLI